MTAIIYFSDSIGRLATIDADTGTVSVIGSTGIAFTDLAFAPNGQLYGITADNLYTVDKATGQATFVGALGTGNMGGAVFGIDGSLYTASFSNDTLAVVDASSGATISTTNTGFVNEGDLFWNDGTLYLNSTGNDVVALNSDHTGGTAALNYGTLTLTGLARVDDGRVFGFASNKLYQIDLATGSVTSIANLAGTGVGSVQGSAVLGETTAALLPLTGSAGPDDLIGTALPERILAGGGNDFIFANAGTDSILGQTGNDVIYGNEGADTISGNDGNDTIFGGKDMDSLTGNDGNDIVYGNLAVDTMDGGVGQDVLYGGQGADSMSGGAGDDFLWGNRDDDILTGGGDSDTFLFQGNSGNDVITDFSALNDKLYFSATDSGFVTIDDVVAASSANGGNLLITLGNGATVTLNGIAASDLTTSNVFVF